MYYFLSYLIGMAFMVAVINTMLTALHMSALYFALRDPDRGIQAAMLSLCSCLIFQRVMLAVVQAMRAPH